MVNSVRGGFYAKPELRERLVWIHGKVPGYREWVNSLLSGAGAKRVNPSFINNVLAAREPAPAQFVLALTRIAEDDMRMPRDTALGLSPSWFEYREKVVKSGQ